MNWFQRRQIKKWESKYLHEVPYSSDEWCKVLNYLREHPSVVYRLEGGPAYTCFFIGNGVILRTTKNYSQHYAAFSSKNLTEKRYARADGDFRSYYDFPEKVSPVLRQRLKETLSDFNEYLQAAKAEEVRLVEEKETEICKNWGVE